jgi:hypothetical protein
VFFGGEMQGEPGGFEPRVPEVARHEAEGDAGFQERRGVGMAEGMDGNACFGNTGTLYGFAEGALDTSAAQGKGGGRSVFLIPPGGGTEPGGVTVCCPVDPQQLEGVLRQRDVSVFGAFASMDMHLEALGVNVGDLKREGFVEPESKAIDSGKIDLIVQGCGGLKKPPDFLDTEDGWETVFSLSANERQGMPVTVEDVLRAKPDAAGAHTHGRWSEAIDVCAVQEVGLKFRFGDHVWGCAIELSEQAYFTAIGLLGTFAFATELERIDHLLTQWGHEMSPLLS